LTCNSDEERKWWQSRSKVHHWRTMAAHHSVGYATASLYNPLVFCRFQLNRAEGTGHLINQIGSRMLQPRFTAAT
jgi:hypothetical protein